MPRAKEFDPAAALALAVKVFWRNGYDGTSLDELVKRMHIGRQSLYDTFGDKRDLYLRALCAYRDSTQAGMRAVFASGQPVRACVAAILYGICRESRAEHERGCLLLSANLERDLSDRKIAALVRSNQLQCEAIFAAALRAAQAAGDLAADKDAEALGRFFVATLQGMRSTARAMSDRRALEQVAALALSTLD